MRHRQKVRRTATLLCLLTLGPQARAQPPTADAKTQAQAQPEAASPATRVWVRCAALSSDDAAAFEARVRADLAVRGQAGTLSLDCDPQPRLRWRPAVRGDERVRALSRTDLSPDRLLELSEELLGSEAPDGRAATDNAVPSSPESQDTASTALTPKAPARTSPVLTPKTPAGVEAPLPPVPLPPNSRPQGATATDRQAARPQPSRVVPPAAGVAQPATKHPGLAPVTEAELPFDRRIGITLGAGIWYTQPCVGLNLDGAWQVGATLALAAGVALQQSVFAPQDYSARTAQLDLGVALELHPEWTLSALLGAQAANVEATDRVPLGEPDKGCSASGSNAWCFSPAARTRLLWTVGRGPWRPQLGIQAAWVLVPVRITEGGVIDQAAPEPGTSQQFALPWIRPSVVLGVVWVPSATH